jgi:hypothetical protein
MYQKHIAPLQTLSYPGYLKIVQLPRQPRVTQVGMTKVIGVFQ